MLLSVLKHGGTWEHLAPSIKLKAPAFETIIFGVLCVIGPYVYEAWVQFVVEKKWAMRKLAVD
ncbi:TPA: hypothetical protein N0F65_000661 [Lagenidium giganteum]|uniref:Uncharacterized protein n=1 Tax=Lagenidium giganteum TaxID=4803 RepID=A0AAV2YS29_9STRA|nr:TPA: hypothetical protein N0F65_000661 [Lagenidium giganteum]